MVHWSSPEGSSRQRQVIKLSNGGEIAVSPKTESEAEPVEPMGSANIRAMIVDDVGPTEKLRHYSWTTLVFLVMAAGIGVFLVCHLSS